MYSIQRYPKGKIDRYFLPNQINPKVILKAIKVQQQKLSTSPAKNNNQLTIEKIAQEAKKLDLLRINGRQFTNSLNKTDTKLRSKTKQINIRKLKFLANQPIDKILDIINKDPNSSQYQTQVKNLHKIKHTASVTTKIDKQFVENQLPQSQIRGFDNIQQYEKMIVNNPALYKKIMCAYKNTKRQADKQARQTMIKKSIPKQNNTEIKRLFKKQEPSLKSLQQQKKNVSISQYRQFLFLINASNCQIVIPNSQGTYKCFICKGNNGTLVKNMIKTRPWWGIKNYSDVQNCNLVWTQWKKTKLTNNMRQTQKNYVQKPNQIKNIQQNIGTSKNIQILQKNKKKAEQIINLVNILPLNSQNQKILASVNIQEYFCFTRKFQPLRQYQQSSQKYIKNLKTVLKMNRKQNIQALNHIPGCLHLHSKKLLYLNLKKYCQKSDKSLEDIIPQTYLIAKSQGDDDFYRFLDNWQKGIKNKQKGKNAWICKPGQNSNRGNGIVVLNSLQQIRNLIKNRTAGGRSTVIVQKYMENPMLFNKRKFDIRCFILITTVNGILKGYWYNDAYIRTACKQYNLKDLDNKYIHLTNDAIQKKSEDYGKFQNHNKLTLNDFQKYLASLYGQNFSFAPTFNKMKQMAGVLIRSVGQKMNINRKQYCFELFGLDFMIDDKLKPVLIQANSNPCLQVGGSVLGKIIPSLIQNTLRIAVDPIFPPPFNDNSKMIKFQMNNPFQNNKFELVYDSLYQNSSNQNRNEINEEDMRNEFTQGQMDQFEEQEEQKCC